MPFAAVALSRRRFDAIHLLEIREANPHRRATRATPWSGHPDRYLLGNLSRFVSLLILFTPAAAKSLKDFSATLPIAANCPKRSKETRFLNTRPNESHGIRTFYEVALLMHVARHAVPAD